MKKSKLLSIFISSFALLNPINSTIHAKGDVKIAVGIGVGLLSAGGVAVGGKLLYDRFNKKDQNTPIKNKGGVEEKMVNRDDEKIKAEDISVIFDEEPAIWGFRGDPGFWEHLRKFFKEYKDAISANDLENIIKGEHKKHTGEELTESSIASSETFRYKGMGECMVNGKFWIETGIPLLKERLRELKS